LVGYARVSTVEQDAGFEAQERDLKAAGAERLFSERTSAVGPRKALDEAIDFVREGDAIVVTKLDRLARSVGDLVRIAERLEAKRVGLRVLAMGVDTAAPTGKLVVNVLGAIGCSSSERSCLSASARASSERSGKASTRVAPRPPTAMRMEATIIRITMSRVNRNRFRRRAPRSVRGRRAATLPAPP
jgi:hypothetical protein